MTQAGDRNGQQVSRAGDTPRCAIVYSKNAFEVTKESAFTHRMVRHDFLRALCRSGSANTVACYTRSSTDFADFARLVGHWTGQAREAIWLPADHGHTLDSAACLMHLDPQLASFAWRRRIRDSRAYSLCGVAHRHFHGQVVEDLGALLIGPVQQWDALVCTSEGQRTAVRALLESWADYLASRIGSRPVLPIQMPIIPMGVDWKEMQPPTNYKARRKACRQRWQVTNDQVVVLCAGQLSFHTRANPHPLFVAVREARQRTGKDVRVVLAGEFGNDSIRQAYFSAWNQTCPGVPLVLTTWHENKDWSEIWWGADVFASLNDNVPNTTDLTLLQAMAAGLPVLVSDWDGSREVVRHGVDGFRVPTKTPGLGSGNELARRYVLGMDSYDRFVGQASGLVAVDREGATKVLTKFVEDPKLRMRMGEAARNRAREFDWGQVIHRYEELWRELQVLRQEAPETGARGANEPFHPLRQDPLGLCNGSGTNNLTDGDRLVAIAPDFLHAALALDVLNVARPVLASPQQCQRILKSLQEKERTAGELLQGLSGESAMVARRTLVWMYKAGLIRIRSGGEDELAIDEVLKPARRGLTLQRLVSRKP
jgi:alpha-maltose-1-phosphate synthase